MASTRAARALTPLTLVLLISQAAIVVTGGAVRLTGSGLGCPTWPECTPGSYVPVENQAEGVFIHGLNSQTVYLLLCWSPLHLQP